MNKPLGPSKTRVTISQFGDQKVTATPACLLHGQVLQGALVKHLAHLEELCSCLLPIAHPTKDYSLKDKPSFPKPFARLQHG